MHEDEGEGKGKEINGMMMMISLRKGSIVVVIVAVLPDMREWGS